MKGWGGGDEGGGEGVTRGRKGGDAFDVWRNRTCFFINELLVAWGKPLFIFIDVFYWESSRGVPEGGGGCCIGSTFSKWFSEKMAHSNCNV